MENVLTTAYEVIWAPLVYVALIGGLVYSVLTRFVQVRHLPGMISSLASKRDSATGTTSFQSFTMALGGRVGVGNIAGVATAVASGGPGALFWMVAAASLAASTAFIEATLGQIYKVKIGDEYRGGIPWYIEKGIGAKGPAVAAAVLAILCYTLLIPGVQSSTIVTSVESAFSIPTWITGIALTALTAAVVFGGTQRIATFTQYVVPFMAAAYIVMAIVVSVINAPAVPGVIATVLASAFGLDAVFGGLLGAAIAWGVRRSLYSNVAGVGEGGFAGAAASVSHPVKQGLVQSFSVYVDTVLVCTATGIMILSTNAYNVFAQDGSALVEHLPGVEAGASFTQQALDVSLPGTGIGGGFVAVAIFFFAFTSILSYFYFGVTNTVYLTGKNTGALVMVVQLVVLFSVFMGTIRSTQLVWTMGDIGYGLIAWTNMIALVFLIRPVLRTLRDYERQQKQGLDPIFDPRALGIKGATYWEETVETRAMWIAAARPDAVAEKGQAQSRQDADD